MSEITYWELNPRVTNVAITYKHKGKEMSEELADILANSSFMDVTIIKRITNKKNSWAVTLATDTVVTDKATMCIEDDELNSKLARSKRSNGGTLFVDPRSIIPDSVQHKENGAVIFKFRAWVS
jgi:hypothetical protein